MRKRWMAAVLTGLLLFPLSLVQAKAQTPVDVEGVQALCLMEVESGTILWEYEGDKKLDAAGLVRLPALLMACEEADAGRIAMEDTVSVSDAAARIGGTTAFLSAGERIEAGELYKSGVMITAGDAIYALSEAAFASDAVYLSRLHERLRILSVGAAFEDRMGKGVLLSARELASLGRALLQSPTFLSYSSLYYDTLTHASGLVTEMASSNKLLKSCAGTNGVATGSSQEAGYCGVFSAQRDGNSFVCCVLGAENAAQRAEIAKALLEYAFSGYEIKRIAGKDETLFKDIPVLGGKETDCDLIAAETKSIVLPRQEGAYTENVQIPQTLTAPLRAGEALGKIVYLDADGQILAQVDLTIKEDIEKASWQDYLGRLIAHFLHQ